MLQTLRVAAARGWRRLPSGLVPLSSASLVPRAVFARRPTILRQFHASRAAHKVIGFKLADIGEGIAEVEIMQWFVKPGDKIAQFDKVCEVQSDKATVEITSRYDGVIKELKGEVGKMIAVGSDLVTMEVDHDTHETSAHAKEAKNTSASASAPGAAAAAAVDFSASNDKAQTSPAVRRIAKEQNIDLNLVKGTGPNGRILKEDVLNFKPGAAPAAPAAPAGAPPVGVARPAAAPRRPSIQIGGTPPPDARGKPKELKLPAASCLPADHVHAVTGVQRVMVKSMTRAATVPAFLFCDEIELDNLVGVRALLKPLAQDLGVSLSFFPFILKAASQALLSYPSLNAHVNADCTEVVWKASHNIGFAMDTPRGLVVPVIHDVQNMSVLEIGSEMQRLIHLGMENKLTNKDLSGGTFSLSNIGAIGGTYAAPILVVPEVVIGALGRMQTLPRFAADGKTVVPKTVMNVSWAGDHRVVDGATIARFSNLWKQYLENPASFVLSLR